MICVTTEWAAATTKTRWGRICSIAAARSEALAFSSSWTTNALVAGLATRDSMRSTNPDGFAHASYFKRLFECETARQVR
jgi:hypothetical protein